MIRARLAVTLPTALPMAISTLPSKAAMEDTRSSGRVVAKLTTVAPTISLGDAGDLRHPGGSIHKGVATLDDQDDAQREEDYSEEEIHHQTLPFVSLRRMKQARVSAWSGIHGLHASVKAIILEKGESVKKFAIQPGSWPGPV